METPSSTKRVTRSQAKAASSANTTNLLFSKKVEESDMKSRRRNNDKRQQQDRSALIDITNDSPIVSLAMGSLKTTPLSAMSKKRVSSQGQFCLTPGSGEALLRGQVKTLLQKVEEEAEISKFTLDDSRPLFNLQCLHLHSPIINLVAPTPANTPQISVNGDSGLPSLTPSPVEEKLLIPQMVAERKGGESEDMMVTRSLLLDFSEKSESSDCSSVVTCQGALCFTDTESSQEKSSTDDDNASVWSMQVNLSSARDEEENADDDSYYYYDEEEEEDHDDHGDDNGGILDELCEGMSKISVGEGPQFTGKHVRFVYNSDDDEIKGEEDVFDDGDCESPPCGEVLRLKGLPAPKGKHLRFPQEPDDN